MIHCSVIDLDRVLLLRAACVIRCGPRPTLPTLKIPRETMRELLERRVS